MSAAAYQGPVIPLVEPAGGAGALARTYALAAVDGAATASGLRPEIAPLMDHGLYGSGNAALSHFEAHALPRNPCAAIAARLGARNRFQLGIRAETDIHVADDRSADLGLLLTCYGAASKVPLSHVVATGSLRLTRGTDAPEEVEGKVHAVSGLAEKANLTARLIEQGSFDKVVFIYPSAAVGPAGNDFAEALARLDDTARVKGVTLKAVPVASVDDALRTLGIRRQAGGGLSCALAALVLVSVAGYFGADWYASRPLELVWGEVNVEGTPYPTPLVVSASETSGRYRACPVARGADQVALVTIKSQLLFAIAGDLPDKHAMAMVAVSERSGVRVRDLDKGREIKATGKPAGLRIYTTDVTVELPVEYTRIMIVARRFGAVNLEELTASAVAAYGELGADGGIDAVSNLLKTRFPGYVDFGFRSTEQDVTCKS